jgi:hypothetical protein
VVLIRVLSEYLYLHQTVFQDMADSRPNPHCQILKPATYFRDRPRLNDSLHAL